MITTDYRHWTGFSPPAAIVVTALTFAIFTCNYAEARGIKLGRALSGGASALKQYGKHGTEYTLTVGELKICLVTERHINKMQRDIDADRLKIDKMKMSLRFREAAIRLSESEVDEYSKSSVDSYNLLVTEYERSRHELNNAVQIVNDMVLEHNTAVSQYQEKCSGKSYYIDDLAAAELAIN
jgi:hypothetical protein